MAKSRTVVKDFGLKRFVQLAEEISKAQVAIGVHGTASPHETDDGELTSAALVATVNEFGSDDGHVPERSFLRSTFDEQLPALKIIRNRVIENVVLGKMSPATGLGLIGAHLAGKVQEKISSGVPPENAPSTIRAKGSSRTLVDTGQLRQSITYEVHPEGFAASAEVEE